MACVHRYMPLLSRQRLPLVCISCRCVSSHSLPERLDTHSKKYSCQCTERCYPHFWARMTATDCQALYTPLSFPAKAAPAVHLLQAQVIPVVPGSALAFVVWHALVKYERQISSQDDGRSHTKFSVQTLALPAEAASAVHLLQAQVNP